MGIGYLCPNCNEVFEMPREEVVKMHKAIMSYSSIPKEELELFKQLKDLKVIFDVGAREDIDYLEFWPESEFHLFEPHPEFSKNLQEKVKDKPKVFVNAYGLGDKKEGRGYHAQLQSFSGSGAIGDGNAMDYLLPLTTLGAYVTEENVKQIDFLKIDTEGFDRKVILGAYNWLHMIKYIQYEHWGEVDNKMIKGLLADKFECYDVGYRNVFCMNKELVSECERLRLKKYIEDNKLAELI